jgi:hypothetical protein
MAPDPEITGTKYSTRGQDNVAGHANPDVDAAYQAAREATTLAERGAHYKQLQAICARTPTGLAGLVLIRQVLPREHQVLRVGRPARLFDPVATMGSYARGGRPSR